MGFLRADHVVGRQVHDSYFLIDITQNYFDEICHLYEINQVGQFVWERLPEMSAERICEELYTQVGGSVDYAEIQDDINGFLLQLCSLGFVVEA